jgi:hypothetical protein
MLTSLRRIRRVSDATHDAVNGVAVEGAALVSDEPTVGADVVRSEASRTRSGLRGGRR